MLTPDSPLVAAGQLLSNSPAVPAVPGYSDAAQNENPAGSPDRCG